MEANRLKQIIEAALMSAGGALKLEQLAVLFEGDSDAPSNDELLKALHQLMQECEGRGVELREVSSGFRYQARQELSQWVQRLWEEKPQRYSRALLETLALIAYRQPITRAEIEEVRGVSVSSTIIKTLQEREWVRVVGHRDVPGKPAMYATTRGFLDYFNLQSLDELPSLAEIRDIDNINAELVFDASQEQQAEEAAAQAEAEFAAAEAEQQAGEAALASEEGSVATAPEEESEMTGLSDEEMRAIDAMNKAFRANLHGTAESEVDEETLPEAAAEDEAPFEDAGGVDDEHAEPHNLEQDNNP